MTDDPKLCSSCYIFGFSRPSWGNLCPGCYTYGLCTRCEKKHLCFICRESLEDYDAAKDPRLGREVKQSAMCTRHGKERGVTNLVSNGDGTYHCKEDEPCKEKAVKAKARIKAKTKLKATKKRVQNPIW